jgi:hypothetical protein
MRYYSSIAPGLLILLGFILLGLLLFGCAQPPLVAPSTAAVRGQIERAQRFNDLARDRAGRIDAKAGVIDKYWDTSK